MSSPDIDRPVLPASKSFWQIRPPGGSLLIQPWHWGKVRWGASVALAVLSLYNPGRWQVAHSSLLPPASAGSLFIDTVLQAQQGSAGQIRLVATPFGPRGGARSCCSNPLSLSRSLPDPMPFFIVYSYSGQGPAESLPDHSI